MRLAGSAQPGCGLGGSAGSSNVCFKSRPKYNLKIIAGERSQQRKNK